MTEVTHEEAVAAENATKNLADIVRGRMPAVLVYVIRYVSHGEDVKDAALAKMYGTTPGKISDIKKFSNFKYIDSDWKPSADDIETGKTWAQKMRDADWADDSVKAFAEDIDQRLDVLELASESELAAQEEARKGSRKPRVAKEDKEDQATDVQAEADESETSEVDDSETEVTDDLADLID